MKVKKEVKREIEIPKGVEVEIADKIKVKGKLGILERKLSHPRIKIQKSENKIEVASDLSRRKEKALVGTFAAHINNMITGVDRGFEYRLKTVYSHFPMKPSIKGNELIIENFMGERSPRKAEIIGDTKVEIKGDNLFVKGINIEEVGQTAANIERATKIKKRDIRVFQDGIYITDKGR
jgi:large subunit ribosomal protein L6